MNAVTEVGTGGGDPGFLGKAEGDIKKKGHRLGWVSKLEWSVSRGGAVKGCSPETGNSIGDGLGSQSRVPSETPVLGPLCTSPQQSPASS